MTDAQRGDSDASGPFHTKSICQTIDTRISTFAAFPACCIMDPLASEDTANAPGAVSDELIHAENDQIEQQQQEAQGICQPIPILCAHH